MRQMRSLVVLAFSVFFGFSAIAGKKLTGKDFIRDISNQTKEQTYTLDQLPQNIGGNNRKLADNRSEVLTNQVLAIGLSDEAVFQQVQKSIIEPLENEMTSKLLNGTYFHENSKNFSFGLQSPARNIKHYEGITETQWSLSSKTQNFKDFKKEFNKYLSNFKKIDFVELSPYSIKTPVSRRSPTTFQPNHFTIEVRADIRGLDSKNLMRQDNFVFVITAERSAANQPWTARSLNLQSGESFVTASKAFKEVLSVANVEPANYLRREAIRRGGYAISTCDYDNDGFADLIIGHMGPSEVFKGKGDGRFTKVSNEALGLENETLAKSIVCNDFDNDGLKDLMFVRFAPSEQKGNDIILYRNTGAKFVKDTTIKNRQPTYYAMPSAVADYNNDGLLDFYIGFPGAKDFTVLNKSAHGFVDLKEPHPQGLFYNLGKFSFNEVTKEKIPYSKTSNAYTDGYPEAAVVFPHTSSGVDYDLDGNMDIVVVDDKANLSPLYKNTGNGNFVQVADKIGVTNYNFGMGFTAADLDNDGMLEFIYTNVNFLPFERLHNGLVNNFSEYSKIPGTYGVRIFKTKDGKNYSDVTAISGITNTGYGVGGVEVIDYNNDGLFDIYVPTGLWSGNDKNQDITSLFSRAYAKFDLDYQEVIGSPEGVEQANTSFMKILTDFTGDVTSLVPNQNTHPSMTGFQKNRLFRNNGDGTFTDVAYMLGVDSISDGYVVTTADLNQDGNMDLVLRNADPGTDKNKFSSVQVYLNQNKLKNKSVILSFEGSRSNKDGVGVIVEAQLKDKKLVRHLVANNGAAQSQGILHFGLGKQSKIDSLKIRWPSGVVDLYKNIPAGYRHYKESSSHISASN